MKLQRRPAGGAVGVLEMPNRPNTAFQIREIQPGDEPVMATIIRDVMTEWGVSGAGFSIHDAEVDHMWESYSAPGSAYYVVVNPDGVVVGGGGIAPLLGGDPGVCELKKMYFLSEVRGQGVGQRLLKICLDRARCFGYTQCYLETHDTMYSALHLYGHAGFQRIEEPLGATGHVSCNVFYLYPL